MAKSHLNVVMQGASGKIGKTLVFRQMSNGETVIANRSKPRTGVATFEWRHLLSRFKLVILNLTNMKYRVFDDEFKKMAVSLSKLKVSVKDAATELDIDPSMLSKWRNKPEFNGGKIMMDIAGLSEEQMEIRRLKKALKNAELERDILKKAVGIFSKGDGGYTDL